MTDVTRNAGDLLAAWFAVLADKPVHAADVLRAASDSVAKRDDKASRLREAIRATTYGRSRTKYTAKGFGHFLSKLNALAEFEPIGRYRLERFHDTAKKQAFWRVVDEHAEAEQLAELQRETHRRIEADPLSVERLLPDKKPPPRVDLDKGIDRDRNEKALTDIQRAEAELRERKKREAQEIVTTIAPRYLFRSDAKAERCAEQVRGQGYEGSLVYVGRRFAILIAGEFDDKRLRDEALRLGLLVHQQPRVTVTDKPVRDVRPLPEIGYDPASKFVMRATADGPGRTAGGAIRSNPYLSFSWKVLD